MLRSRIADSGKEVAPTAYTSVCYQNLLAIQHAINCTIQTTILSTITTVKTSLGLQGGVKGRETARFSGVMVPRL